MQNIINRGAHAAVIQFSRLLKHAHTTSVYADYAIMFQSPSPFRIQNFIHKFHSMQIRLYPRAQINTEMQKSM